MANFISQYSGSQVEEAVRKALLTSQAGLTGNYHDLLNKPIYCETTAYWQSQRTFIGIKGDIIVYSDYKTDKDGNHIAGIKIADGLTYAIDLPFVTSFLESELTSHINNTSIHISEQEREKWGNNVAVRMGDNDTLILY